MLRERLCYALSRRLMRPPDPARHASGSAQGAWRDEEQAREWGLFSDDRILGKDVLDFGCGVGGLTFLLASRGARSVKGVDLDPGLIAAAERRRAELPEAARARIELVIGTKDALPFPDHGFDAIVSFDVMEHVMEPAAIFGEWRRVLRPGGRVMLRWQPFRGPYGPHMESLIPIPWAHVWFGERAMFETAARIYDDPDYVPRPWDLDDEGRKKPNKWRAWSTFAEQGFVNQLTLDRFRDLAERSGLGVARLERHTFGGSPARRAAGSALVGLPVVGEYVTSFVVAELVRR